MTTLQTLWNSPTFLTQVAVTHITFKYNKHACIMLLNNGIAPNMQLTTVSPEIFFSDISMIFGQIPNVSLRAVKFPGHFLIFTTSGNVGENASQTSNHNNVASSTMVGKQSQSHKRIIYTSIVAAQC